MNNSSAEIFKKKVSLKEIETKLLKAIDVENDK
jgi:hypothetical protein